MSAVDSPILGWGNPPEDEQLYPLSISSIAYSASLVVKSGPGLLCGFTVYNSSTSAQFILVMDAASLPADGVVPRAVFVVGAGGTTAVAGGMLAVNWIPARAFQTGIVIVNSSTAVTKTIGSANCWFDAQYL